MKCPKCGFTSFEIYDNCRKCSADLVTFKQKHKIIPMVMPEAILDKMASNMGLAATISGAGDGGYTFTFETPGAGTTIETADVIPDIANSMIIESTTLESSLEPAAVYDPFAELMGKASQQAEPVQTKTDTDQGFELNSFSFDDLQNQDSPWESSSDKPSDSSDDNFKSLFGGLDETDNKQAQL